MKAAGALQRATGRPLSEFLIAFGEPLPESADRHGHKPGEAYTDQGRTGRHLLAVSSSQFDPECEVRAAYVLGRLWG